jgi:hypothetical protein
MRSKIEVLVITYHQTLGSFLYLHCLSNLVGLTLEQRRGFARLTSLAYQRTTGRAQTGRYLVDSLSNRVCFGPRLGVFFSFGDKRIAWEKRGTEWRRRKASSRCTAGEGFSRRKVTRVPYYTGWPTDLVGPGLTLPPTYNGPIRIGYMPTLTC